MCGICGIFGADLAQKKREPVVRGMMDLLAHRGPDDQGFYQGPWGMLGHRRLAVIDLKRGRQPMFTPDGRYVLVFNGEIYNYLELRQELIRLGMEFHTFSDTEVLLNILVYRGTDWLPRLNGMFAFAFLDTRTGRWLLGRDHLGIKPLYYLELEDELVFASEIKALLLHPDLRPQVDWEGLQQYLLLQFCLGEQTLFRGVKRLEPGFFLEGTGGRLRQRRQYWDVDYTIDEEHGEGYFLDRLRFLISDSVRLQTRSDVPLGSHLSGGLDSCTVAIMACEHLGEPVKLFHGRFAEGPAYDESPYARRIAQERNCPLYVVTPTAHDLVEDLPRLIFAMDEPAAGPGLFPQYQVSRLARQHVTVVLGGQGGDEIFGGYARYLIAYLEQALKGAILGTQEEGRHIVTLQSIIPNLGVLRTYLPLMQHFWREGLFEDMDARYFRLINRSPDIDRLLTPEAKDHCSTEAVFESFRQVFNHPQTRSYLNKMTHFDLKTLLPALLQVEDRVSMAVSLESRVPLLDYRIVELMGHMPPALKFKGGRTKHILKSALENLLPSEIIHRQDKMGFPVPLREWVRQGPVRDFVREVLLGRACRERGVFSVPALEGMLARESILERQLWGAICLELWFQTFFDASPSQWANTSSNNSIPAS